MSSWKLGKSKPPDSHLDRTASVIPFPAPQTRPPIPNKSPQTTQTTRRPFPETPAQTRNMRLTQLVVHRAQGGHHRPVLGPRPRRPAPEPALRPSLTRHPPTFRQRTTSSTHRNTHYSRRRGSRPLVAPRHDTPARYPAGAGPAERAGQGRARVTPEETNVVVALRRTRV